MAAEIPPEVFDRFDHNLQQDIFFAVENQRRFAKKHFGFLYVTIQPDVVGKQRCNAIVIEALDVAQSRDIVFGFLE
jgi:hypothetical protein